MQQTNRDAIDPAPRECARRLHDGRLVERHVDRAEVIDPFAYFEPVAPADQRRRRTGAKVVDLLGRAGQARDFQHVAKSRGADHADPRAGALECRVGGNRRAVNQITDIEFGGVAELLDRGDNRLGRIGLVGRDFGAGDQAFVLIPQHTIRKGSAGIDTDTLHPRFSRSRWTG